VRDLAKLPKAHLHLHFTGSMRLATAKELAAAKAIRLPAAFDARDHLDLAPDQRGWFRFQRLYDSARRAVDSEAAMRRIVREAAQDDAAEGSGRLELQIDPTSYAPFTGGLTPALEIVLDEAKTASHATGTEVAVIVAASRLRHPLEARTLARLAAKHAGSGPGQVVGFGLSNDERAGVTDQFGPAFDIARRAGLAAVPHGGELLGPAHVMEVLQALRPVRIGHGVRAAERPSALAAIARAGVALELCPTSNVALGIFPRPEDVPLRAILDAGVEVSLNADDPLIFGSRLTAQYAWARHTLKMSDAELAGLAKSSIRASLAGTTTKARLLAGVDAWLAGPG
jgi:adenosine deaminase